QELAFVVAAAVEYLRALTSGGVDIATSLANIELRIAATADQFATVAKIRALRRVWARVAEACGAPEAAAATTIHAVTSRAMMTRYDPWVNSLRTTVACFAAGVAGADSITVLPYDHAAPADGSELGLRLARNTQAVLALESNLARVIDPGGGSWYVEHLTAALAAAAWSDFQEVEAAGGFAVAATSGLIRERLAATWHEREAQIANRSSSITGVSEFPDIDEVIASPPVRGSVAAEALPVHRYAEQFEQLRGRVDHAGAVTGHRPVVFLAALGDLATSTARIAYAKSFFETAGVVTVTGPAGASPAEIIDAFHQSDANVACLCSSDAFYAEHAVHAAEAIKAAGATYLYLAGRPRALVDQLEQAGVDRLIYTGCDVHATLAELLDVLEVP
ncbi:MAG TPA: methylmalonyl-CoA mutase family protein, partial [Ilumatobacteraceae bacterium]